MQLQERYEGTEKQTLIQHFVATEVDPKICTVF